VGIYVYNLKYKKKDVMPKTTIWIPKDEEENVKGSAKAHGIGLGALLVKLVNEDKERKARGFHL
jgi:hypothetical protein